MAKEKPLGEVRTAGLAQPTTTIFDPIQFLHFFLAFVQKVSFLPHSDKSIALVSTIIIR